MGYDCAVMNPTLSEPLVESLRRHNQLHVLRWWDELNEPEQIALAEQLKEIDFDLVARLAARGPVDAKTEEESGRGQRARPPARVVRLPQSPRDELAWTDAARRGREVLAAGKVGVILVAGGQGTRLNFSHPKGMFPIGPVSAKPLFQILAEQVLARSRQAGMSIPYGIMTSESTHDETARFFHMMRHFGLPEDDVHLFRQGNMPTVSDQGGQLLMASKAKLSTSPNGHGGMLAALADSGLLDEMGNRGVEYLFYHQVDNPTAKVCDPAFIGHHAIHGSEMSTKVVMKRSPSEKMGVVVDVDGQTQIIEYSDLPIETAQKTDENGQLLLWAGNTAIHCFNVEFLQRILDDHRALPFHLAHKAVPYLDESGQLVKPQGPNAFKFEQFIFDALPSAKRALVVEADRRREFNPVKNESGQDSPESVKQAMSSIYGDWLRWAGAEVEANVPVEISPLFALDADQLRDKIQPGTKYSKPAYLHTNP